MITLKYKDINNGAFQQALHKLSKTTAFTPKEAYNVARISDKVGQETRHAKELYFKILKKYAKTNEKGDVVQTNTAPFFEFSETADKTAWEKDYAEFLDISFEIARNKIAIEAIPTEASLSPQDMLALESLWLGEAVNADNVIPIKKDEK